MSTYVCSTVEDPEERPDPIQLSQVYMNGRWTFHAVRVSHDGRFSVQFEKDGYTLRDMKANKSVRLKCSLTSRPKGFYWGPDNKQLIYWAPPEDNPNMGRCVSLLDARRVTEEHTGGPPPHKTIYVPPKGHVPYGLEWSPSGKRIYVLERFYEHPKDASRLVEVDLSSQETREVCRMEGRIDFFMPPVARFENGSGPSNKPYWIIFGHYRGLFIVDPRKGAVRRVSEIPATGLHNCEWHPKREELLLFFRRPSVNTEGKSHRGVVQRCAATTSRVAENALG